MAATVCGGPIKLNWTASTDNVGVTGYLVERQDPGSTTFVQIGTTTTASTYTDTGLAANSTYSYRVRATNAAGNLSPYSNVASASTSAGNAAPLLHISPHGRYFLDHTNQPFYLIPVTAWALPAGLTLSQAT